MYLNENITAKDHGDETILALDCSQYTRPYLNLIICDNACIFIPKHSTMIFRKKLFLQLARNRQKLCTISSKKDKNYVYTVDN